MEHRNMEFTPSPDGWGRYFTSDWWNGTSLWWRLAAVFAILTGLVGAYPGVDVVTMVLPLAVLTLFDTFMAARTHVWRHLTMETRLENNTKQAGMGASLFLPLSLAAAFLSPWLDTMFPWWASTLGRAGTLAGLVFFCAVFIKNICVQGLVNRYRNDDGLD